jgi:uncharacterized protein YkwD
MRSVFLPVFLAAAILGSAAAACTVPEDLRALRTSVLAEVNAQRAAHGLPKLTQDKALEKAAQGHACDNAARRSISHDSSNGDTLKERLQKAGYRLRTAAENTGRGFGTPQRAVAWWMQSPHHKDNILMEKATEIGVGIAVSDAPDSKYHWILNFGQPR